MKIVTLPFKDGIAEEETKRGVDISRWLKSQGLTMGRDYTWKVNIIISQSHLYGAVMRCMLPCENLRWDIVHPLDFLASYSKYACAVLSG